MVSVFQCFLLVLVVAAVSASKSCHEKRQFVLDLQEKYKAFPGWAKLLIPKCEDDGTFSPQQCISGTYCSCVDAEGNGIADYSYYSSNPNLDGCRCAREKDQLHNVIGRTIACDKFGNFETKQCTGSMCNCVHAITGEQIGDAIPISQKNILNC